MFKFELGEIVQSFDGKITGLLVFGRTDFLDGSKGYWLSQSGFNHQGNGITRHALNEYELRATPKKEA